MQEAFRLGKGAKHAPSAIFAASLYYKAFRDADSAGEGCSMPKMKTHKGTKKRFRLTASGKAKHRAAGTSHLASRMSKKRRRNLRGTRVLHKATLHQITAALGAYSS